eukprot:5440764-Alexandrium_andersonii.AAC.1
MPAVALHYRATTRGAAAAARGGQPRGAAAADRSRHTERRKLHQTSMPPMPTVAETAPGSGEATGARPGRRLQGQAAAAVRHRGRYAGGIKYSNKL